MSLSAADVKKIVVNVIFLILILWVYFTNYRGPTLERIRRADKEVGELREKVKVARDQIARTRALEGRAAGAEEVFAYFSQFAREGEPIAWFPPQLEAFFERHGITRADIRLGNSVAVGEPELSQFQALQWTIELPRVGFAPLGFSLATLENEIPTLEIRSLRIETLDQDPEFQRAVLQVATVLKPRE